MDRSGEEAWRTGFQIGGTVPLLRAARRGGHAVASVRVARAAPRSDCGALDARRGCRTCMARPRRRETRKVATGRAAGLCAGGGWLWGWCASLFARDAFLVHQPSMGRRGREMIHGAAGGRPSGLDWVPSNRHAPTRGWSTAREARPGSRTGSGFWKEGHAIKSNA